ncbi:unnamed protein product [Ilex paraguariensis]|uniref:Photosynthesis system II assembly factor Ycf48/Hcf136-like domain-containing protein n=1 Tax=Ilex paraguariensis TaxID=185542 RepID=A0ABC8RPB6_9AQUA
MITEEFEEVPVQSRGFGILDVGYRSQVEAWAAGGSGILLKTTNSGKTWTRDKAADNIAANLYSVKFINDRNGFVLGNDGVLLRSLKFRFCTPAAVPSDAVMYRESETKT